MKKKRLGRGLGSLIGDIEDSVNTSPAASVDGLAEIDIDRIQRGRYQPRHVFAPEALQELADLPHVVSMRRHFACSSTSEERHIVVMDLARGSELFSIVQERRRLQLQLHLRRSAQRWRHHARTRCGARSPTFTPR